MGMKAKTISKQLFNWQLLQAKQMGNQSGSLKKHLETAEKTGALNFTDKGLGKFPPELFKVENNLRNLDLSNNKITALPSNIGNFKMMKNLSMSKNRISSIPEDM